MGKEVDVVISGGSIEGICDAVGFIKALTQDLGFTIASGAAASAGAVVLGVHAAGHDARSLEQTVLNAKFSQWISVPRWYNFIKIYKAMSNGWLSDGEAMYNYMGDLTLHKDFKDINMDLHIVGTDVQNSEVRDFNKSSDPDMSLATAMRISSAVPGCFKPPVYDNKEYLDGSIRSHYPAEMVPVSNRPFYGFLASHVGVVSQKMHSLKGLFGMVMKIVDNSLDINVRYSTQMAPRRPITVCHNGKDSTEGWKSTRSDRVRMIESARIATIEKIVPTLDNK